MFYSNDDKRSRILREKNREHVQETWGTQNTCIFRRVVVFARRTAEFTILYGLSQSELDKKDENDEKSEQETIFALYSPIQSVRWVSPAHDCRGKRIFEKQNIQTDRRKKRAGKSFQWTKTTHIQRTHEQKSSTFWNHTHPVNTIVEGKNWWDRGKDKNSRGVKFRRGT